MGIELCCCFWASQGILEDLFQYAGHPTVNRPAGWLGRLGRVIFLQTYETEPIVPIELVEFEPTARIEFEHASHAVCGRLHLSRLRPLEVRPITRMNRLADWID